MDAVDQWILTNGSPDEAKKKKYKKWKDQVDAERQAREEDELDETEVSVKEDKWLSSQPDWLKVLVEESKKKHGDDRRTPGQDQR